MSTLHPMLKSLECTIRKYQCHILAIILAISALPHDFYYDIQNNLDGAWMRAINIAVHNNSVFGKDFVFTFGPLGYLSTRNTQYIYDIYFLLYDVFVVSSYGYIFYRLVSESKQWFWILFVAIFYCKGREASQLLFLLFTMYVSLNLKNEFKNYYEVVVAAICSVVLFFMKINYGFLMVLIVPLIMLYLMINNRKSFLLFTGTVLCVWSVIQYKTNIDVTNYLRHGFALIVHYGESMQLHLEPTQINFMWAIRLGITFALISVYYIISLIRAGKLPIEKIAVVGLMCFYVFLSYRNAFTRNDSHNNGFFAFMPVFFAVAMFVMGYSKFVVARIVCVLVIISCDYNLNLPYATEGKGFIYNAFVGSVLKYSSHAFEKYDETIDPSYVIPNKALEIIGQQSIDIFPTDVYILQQNKLNYKPRPVLQSYSVYSRSLDSLNAAHFYATDERPEFILYEESSIDNRYPVWDESRTKAMLRLNYDYTGSVSLKNDTTFSDEYGNYLLLKAKKSVPKQPQFDIIYEQQVKLGDTVYINFPDTAAIYASVAIDYSTTGKLNNIIFQPAILDITFLFNSDTLLPRSKKFRAVKPIMSAPVLINKLVEKNSDFLNFISGDLVLNRNISGFYFSANRANDFERNVKIRFYKFSNY
jgi:hypothetical protein